MPARLPVILSVTACVLAIPEWAQAQSDDPAPLRLSVNGRIRYEVIEPAAFGFGPQDPGGYVLWRIAPQVDVDVAPNLQARVNETWSLTGFAGYRRLLGDAADSSVVDL